MAVNPVQLMKLRERFRIFQGQHPRMAPFLKDVGEHGFREGAVVEVKVTTPEGKEYITNMRVTRDDVETAQILHDLTAEK